MNGVWKEKLIPSECSGSKKLSFPSVIVRCRKNWTKRHPPYQFTFLSSALLVCELDSTIFILRLAPGNDIIERFGPGGAREQAREQIGTITLHVGDGATTTGILNNVERGVDPLAKVLRSS